jgi:hypothetical protein
MVGFWPLVLVARENFSEQFDLCFCRSTKFVGKEIQTYRSTKSREFSTTTQSGLVRRTM